jgi:hypothetical protein
MTPPEGKTPSAMGRAILNPGVSRAQPSRTLKVGVW